jgi:hypothetical protein
MNAGFNPLETSLLDLLRQKISIDGTGPVDVSESRHERLSAQLEAQLRPVLRRTDFALFKLDRAFAATVKVARALQ